MWGRISALVCTILALVISPLRGGVPEADSIKKVFAKATKVYLYSIDPNHGKRFSGERPVNSKKVFHGYPVLGRVEIVSPKERKALLDEFVKGIPQDDGNMPDNSCFNPRHGLRMITGSSTNDLVICFQCMQVDSFGFGCCEYFHVSNAPQSVFDGMLSKYKIKKAK